MREQLATLFERLAGKKRFRLLLLRLGLDPEQFVLFLALFRTLSEHEEFMSAIGVNRFNISYMALFCAAFGVPAWLMAASVLPAPNYLLLNLLVTFALIFLIIVREAPNTLFNPVESSIFAHTPVHGPTYASAKIVHVLIAVLYLVCGLTLFPALIGVALRGARWFWPVTHVAAGVLIGVTTAFLICALYGVLVRVVSANWLKQASTWIQLFFLAAFIAIPMFFSTFLVGLLTARYEENLWTWLPWTWFIQFGLLGWRRAIWRFEWQGAFSIVVTIAIIWFGIRSFFGAFAESTSMVEGHSPRRRERKGFFSRGYDAVARALTGSPLGLGACCFVNKMMRRDWGYRRAVLSLALFPFLLMLGIAIAIASGAGSPDSPLSHEMSPSHIVPQLLGLIAIALCANLVFSDFHSGSWIYLTTPIGDLRAYARGIYWGLWFPAAALPYLAMFPFMIRLWGWREAALQVGFSVVVVSLYLAFGITFVAGAPFSSRQEESRAIGKAVNMQMFLIAAIMVPAGLQWALFRIWWVALISGFVLVILTGFVVHWSLGELAEEMRWRLHTMKMGANQMFREIE
jgi:hypothetical protein